MTRPADLTGDPWRAYLDALSTRGRALTPRDHDTVALVTRLCRDHDWTPRALAELAGDTSRGLILTTARMRARLARAAGHDDDHQEDTHS